MSTNFTTPIGRFWNLLKPFSKQIRKIYIYGLFIGLVNLTLPLGIQAIVNFLQTGELTSTWVLLVGFVLIGIAITGILQVLQLRIVENMQQELFAKSAFEFAYRIPKVRFLNLDKIHAPELVNRFFDTLTIQKGLPKVLIDFSQSAFQIIFGLILLTVYSPFFIILGLALAIILWLIFRFTGPIGLTTSLSESKYKYLMAHWLEEIARVNRSFKTNSAQRFHLNKTDDIVGDYVVNREDHFGVLLNQFRLFVGFKVLLAAGLLILGGILVFQERMNIGQFVAAEIIILLIISSVEKILRITETIYDVLTALEKIGYVTDLTLDGHTGKATLNGARGIAINAKEITFGFPDTNKRVLQNLSFEIDALDKAVIKGESGSGKSLLLQILSRVHSIEDGQLYFNNIPISNFEQSSLNRSIGVIFPVNQLFEGTFEENILMGKEVPEDHFQSILQLLDLQNFFNHEELGVHGFVDSGGRRLPRSIIQKIQIARAIIHEPKLLIMEDPLQFINEKEKNSIIDYMTSDERPWTLIVVSDYHYWEEKTNRTIELTKN